MNASRIYPPDSLAVLPGFEKLVIRGLPQIIHFQNLLGVESVFNFSQLANAEIDGLHDGFLNIGELCLKYLFLGRGLGTSLSISVDSNAGSLWIEEGIQKSDRKRMVYINCDCDAFEESIELTERIRSGAPTIEEVEIAYAHISMIDQGVLDSNSFWGEFFINVRN